MTRFWKILRAVVGLVVVVILLSTVNGWYKEYKNAQPTAGSETTGTPAATGTVDPGAKPSEASPADQLAQSEKVVIIVDGLNFRSKPDATGTSIRGLKKGETLILVGRTGTWLQVQDTQGNVGWVNNDPQYLKIVKK